jgi:hypothetical protein
MQVSEPSALQTHLVAATVLPHTSLPLQSLSPKHCPSLSAAAARCHQHASAFRRAYIICEHRHMSTRRVNFVRHSPVHIVFRDRHVHSING